MSNNYALPTVKGFTLIELLVVVLIIGILAAVAVPQYQKAVEKSKMTEAVLLVRAIASANQLYFLTTGKYAGIGDMDLLDISISGQVVNASGNRIQTKDFVYSPLGTAGSELAVAQRIPILETYYIAIQRADPQKIECKTYSKATPLQKELCDELDEIGTL